jgi:hypothetical protein
MHSSVPSAAAPFAQRTAPQRAGNEIILLKKKKKKKKKKKSQLHPNPCRKKKKKKKKKTRNMSGVVLALGFHVTGPIDHHKRLSALADMTSPAHASALELLTEASLARDAAIVSYHRDPGSFPETDEMRAKFRRHLALGLGAQRSRLSAAITFAWSLVFPEDTRSASVVGDMCVLVGGGDSNWRVEKKKKKKKKKTFPKPKHKKKKKKNEINSHINRTHTHKQQTNTLRVTASVRRPGKTAAPCTHRPRPSSACSALSRVPCGCARALSR